MTLSALASPAVAYHTREPCGAISNLVSSKNPLLPELALMAEEEEDEVNVDMNDQAKVKNAQVTQQQMQ